jgi:hypothetical protein
MHLDFYAKKACTIYGSMIYNYLQYVVSDFVSGGLAMGIKTLRLNDIDIATLELRRSGPRGGLLRKFRRLIEESDWDEDLLKFVKWADGLSLVVAIASALSLFSFCLSLVY